MNTYSITLGLPFCHNTSIPEANVSVGLRITAVAIGCLSLLAAALIFLQIPMISHLGSIGQWTTLSFGLFLIVAGIALKCIKKKEAPSPKKPEAKEQEAPRNDPIPETKPTEKASTSVDLNNPVAFACDRHLYIPGTPGLRIVTFKEKQYFLPILAITIDTEEFLRDENNPDWKFLKDALEFRMNQIHEKYGLGVIFHLQILRSLNEVPFQEPLQLGSGYWNHPIVKLLATVMEDNPYIVGTTFTEQFDRNSIPDLMAKNIRTDGYTHGYRPILEMLPEGWDGNQAVETISNAVTKADKDFTPVEYSYGSQTFTMKRNMSSIAHFLSI